MQVLCLLCRVDPACCCAFDPPGIYSNYSHLLDHGFFVLEMQMACVEPLLLPLSYQLLKEAFTAGYGRLVLGTILTPL